MSWKDFVLMDYPMVGGVTSNQSTSSLKTNFSRFPGSYDASLDAWHLNGLASLRNHTMDLSGDWIIQFDYYLNTTEYADWFNMFAFGTHYNDGGDGPTAAIAVNSNRGCTVIYTFSTSFANDNLYHQWHTFTVKGTQGAQTEFYLDGELKNSLNNLGTQSNFYMNGKGGRGDFSSYIRNFRFAIGANMFGIGKGLIFSNIKILN